MLSRSNIPILAFPLIYLSYFDVHVLLVNKLPYKLHVKGFVIDISGDSRVKLVVEIFDTF